MNETKKWLYPLVLIFSVLMVLVSLFVRFYVYGLNYTGETSVWVFNNYSNEVFPDCETIWGILTFAGLLLGIVGIVASLVFTLIELIAKNKFNYKLWATIAFYVTLAGAAMVLVFGILFSALNIVQIPKIGGNVEYHLVTLSTGFFLACGGLIIGALSAALSMGDLIEEEKKENTNKLTATKNKKPESKKVVLNKTSAPNKLSISETKKAEQLKTTQKPETKKSKEKKEEKEMATAKKEVKKAAPKKVVAKKAEVKKAPAKKTVAKKTEIKKAPAKKVEAKKVEAKKAAPAKKVVAKKAEPAKKAPAKKAAPAKKPAAKTSKKK